MQPPPPPQNSQIPRWTHILIIVAVFVTFSPLLPANFTSWDDPHTVYQNLLLNPVRADTWTYYWTNAEARIFVPLTYSVWAALTYVARVAPDDQGITLNPTWYHLANMALHAGAACAVLLTLRRLTGSTWAAVLGALLFGLHPVQVESVGWISGLKDVLAGFISCWAVYMVVRFRQAAGQSRQWAWLVMLVATQLLAVLAKPSAITLPLVVAAVDYLLLRSKPKQVLLVVVLLLLVVAPFAAIARMVQAPRILDHTPIWARPLIAMDSLAFYAGKVVWPATLSIDYGRRPAWLADTGWWYVTPMVTIAIGAGLWVAWRRGHRMLAAGGAVFALAPLHVLGLVRFDFQHYSTTADHYIYFATLGPAMIVAWMVCKCPWSRWIVMVCLVGLAARSFNQCFVWHDDQTLMTHTQQVNPQSPIALNNLSLKHLREGRIEEAKQAWQRAVDLDPTTLSAWANLGYASLMEGDAQRARELFGQMFKTIDTLFHDSGSLRRDAYVATIRACLTAGRPDEAAYWLEEAERIVPGDARLQRIGARVRALNTRPPATRQVTGVSG